MNALSYKVKVRGLTYIWGSDSVRDVTILPLILHLRNSETGDTVTIGTLRSHPRRKKDTAVLRPGESFSLMLHDLSAVYGICDADTQIECGILCPIN